MPEPRDDLLRFGCRQKGRTRCLARCTRSFAGISSIESWYSRRDSDAPAQLGVGEENVGEEEPASSGRVALGVTSELPGSCFLGSARTRM
jgi:hypothetical protein